MKKILFVIFISSAFASSSQAQSNDFDKKFRFGLRITPQPTWFKSKDPKNNIPSGAKFGFGFGLNMEFRLSEIVGVLTGIGGDLEGGKYQFRNDRSNNYEPMYLLDENNELVTPNSANKTTKSNTAYVLKERTMKNTWVTVPLLLKLSTKEYTGLKYYGMFGVELGFRAKAEATDSYYETRKYSNDTAYAVVPGESSLSAIDISKESSKIPARLTFNAGLGAEYRIAGSTAVFVNVNYFMGLSNQMRKESQYIIYKTEPSSGKSTYIQQNLKTSGVRISIGIMF